AAEPVQGAGHVEAAMYGSTGLVPELGFMDGRAVETGEVLLEGVGVERGVLEIDIAVAVPARAPGAGNRVRDEAGRAAVLGGKVAGGEPVLLYGLGRDRGEGSGDEIIVVLDAVQEKVGSGGPLAVHGNAESAGGSGVRRDGRLCNDHAIDIASGEREIPHLDRIDDLGDGGFEGALGRSRNVDEGGPAGVDVGAEEVYDSLAARQEHATELAGFPNIAERAKARID